MMIHSSSSSSSFCCPIQRLPTIIFSFIQDYLEENHDNENNKNNGEEKFSYRNLMNTNKFIFQRIKFEIIRYQMKFITVIEVID